MEKTVLKVENGFEHVLSFNQVALETKNAKNSENLSEPTAGRQSEPTATAETEFGFFEGTRGFEGF